VGNWTSKTQKGKEHIKDKFVGVPLPGEDLDGVDEDEWDD